jgi:hypothetical protein
VFTHVKACCLAKSPSRPFPPKASAASLPQTLLRLLPGGAIQFPGGTCTHCGPMPFTAHYETRSRDYGPWVREVPWDILPRHCKVRRCRSRAEPAGPYGMVTAMGVLVLYVPDVPVMVTVIV